MEVLCFDIGSGGVTAARFNEQLVCTEIHEAPWTLHRDAEGRATLSAYDIECAFHAAAQHHLSSPVPAAISIGCFMHSYLVLSSCCAALTPVFTWLDTTSSEGLDLVRDRIGNRFHEQTGCHYHPMFPVFKLAANPPGRGNRVASPKSWLAWELTGVFAEDRGMASASGLLNVRGGLWDGEILQTVGIDAADLPVIVEPMNVVGKIQAAASERFALPESVPLVAGSGDGFLAHLGSGCSTPQRMSITLGTSGAARQTVPHQVLNETVGTFCYQADLERFLLGCASSNGGNVLDWARREFGPWRKDGQPNSRQDDFPIFLPWMNGERSFEWDPNLRPVWHGREERHSPQQLARAATEGVLFNLGQYVETIERESGVAAAELVLSGNGFLEPGLASLLATILGRELLHPADAGLATLRGAAVCAWQALGHDATPALERLLHDAARIAPERDSAIAERFSRFKDLRAEVHGY